MSLRQKKCVRAAAAWMCMLAVALVYAPLGAAALIANGVGCCVSGYCPVKGHHHHKQQTADEQDSMPADCGHDMGGMMACSMSCCQDQGRPAVVPGTFVLPVAASVPAAGEVIRPVQVTNSPKLSQVVRPLSPPPRFASPVL
ncbi:MAG TPA: hypothetical protein VE077_20255 [Candidatus Methylomirabilis sp.]|nr:hypothetical protein [Candidatus Methylomirabilis sp.]